MFVWAFYEQPIMREFINATATSCSQRRWFSFAYSNDNSVYLDSQYLRIVALGVNAVTPRSLSRRLPPRSLRRHCRVCVNSRARCAFTSLIASSHSKFSRRSLSFIMAILEQKIMTSSYMHLLLPRNTMATHSDLPTNSILTGSFHVFSKQRILPSS